MARTWGDYFAQGFTDAYNRAAQINFEKWKWQREEERLNNPKYIIGQMAPYLAMTGNTEMLNNLTNYLQGATPSTDQITQTPGNGMDVSLGMSGGKPRISIKPKTQMTESEQNALTASQRMQGSLKTYRDSVKNGKLSGLWQQIQTGQKVPYTAVKNQDIQDVKNAIDNLKADIPFMRGGKQLTPMEARRVDVLLDPTGKSQKTILANIDKFEKEFGLREYLATQGKRGKVTLQKARETMGASGSYSNLWE